jgi:hypothetical protein
MIIGDAESVRSGAVAVYAAALVFGVLSAKPVLPKEGADLLVRDVVYDAGGVIDWYKDTSPRAMTITTKSGKLVKLTEGTDFYIDKNDRAHFYNNVRTVLESQGMTVSFD